MAYTGPYFIIILYLCTLNENNSEQLATNKGWLCTIHEY